MEKWSMGATEDADDDVAGASRRPVVTVVGAAHRLAAGPTMASAEETLVIGRTPEGEGPRLVIEDDRQVSRTHARIVPTANAFEVHDLGSGNGTFVGTRPIPASAEAANGSLVFVGGHAVMLRFVSDQARAAIEQDWKTPFMATPTLCPQVALLHQRLRARLSDRQPVLLTGHPGAGKWSYAAALHEKAQPRGLMRTLDGVSLQVDQGGRVVVCPADDGPSPSVARPIQDVADEAHAGTLYLNRVDRASPAVQGAVAGLLRAGLGHSRVILSSCGVVGQPSDSGHALLPELESACRSTRLFVPPLVRRKEDIATIFRHTLGHSAGVTISIAAWRALLLYDWPGNVEQLVSTARRLLVERLAGAPKRIEIFDLPESMRLACGTWMRDLPEPPSAADDPHITISDPWEPMWQKTARRRVSVETAAAEVGGTHGWTPRQIEIITLLARGWSRQEVGNRLDIKDRTVTEQLKRAAEKTKASHPSDLVRMVINWFEETAGR